MAILEEITQEFGLAAGAGSAVAPAARGPSSLGPYPSAASADTALPPYMASAPPPFAAQQAQQLPGGFSFPPQGSSSLPDLLDATSARSAFNYEPTVSGSLPPAGRGLAAGARHLLAAAFQRKLAACCLTTCLTAAGTQGVLRCLLLRPAGTHTAA